MPRARLAFPLFRAEGAPRRAACQNLVLQARMGAASGVEGGPAEEARAAQPTSLGGDGVLRWLGFHDLSSFCDTWLSC
eukprot:735747-Prymnesium_polylepis.1